jgi:hypothetical protein
MTFLGPAETPRLPGQDDQFFHLQSSIFLSLFLFSGGGRKLDFIEELLYIKQIDLLGYFHSLKQR